jgi:glycosyltransferase involved in cell wall biosynthesis
MNRKVFYLIDTLEVGGAEKSLLAILQRIRDTEPFVCHIYKGEFLKPLFEESGIPVVSLGLKGKYRYSTAIKKTLQLLRKHQPHIIHTILTRSHVVGRTAGKIAGIPVVSSLVNDSYSNRRFEQLALSSKLKLRVTQLTDRVTSRWSTHFIANSQAVKTSFCNSLGIPQDKVSVIYRGRDPSRLTQRDKNAIAKLRLSLNLPAATKVILNVGRLIPQKGQKDLIAAMRIVHGGQGDTRLLIAGEGLSRMELIDLIEQCKLSDVIQLLGNRTDVAELLQLADVFVFPSIYEGHPGSLIEAMFTGCAIVASDIPVHRETIRAGETGLLVPVGKPDELASSVSWLLNHPEEATRMGRLAQQDALKRFHINRIAQQHEEIYADLMKRWRIAQ